MTVSARRNALYRTIWRWHFYAGLFVVPMVLILSITGAVYLFKPEVQRWEERSWQGLPQTGAVSPDVQRDAALAAFPGARMHSYRLPEYPGDAVLIHLALPAADGMPGKGAKDSGAMRDVFVSPQGKVLGSLDPQTRLMQIMHDIHGQLLIGPKGSWLVELAASWAIVMILTGLYLWWPQGRGMAGVIWPRLGRGRKALWRDLHAVTGFWVAGLAMVLLVTGLPWAGVWGTAFKTVRQEMGWVKGQQDWTIGGKAPDAGADEHAEHDHAAMASSKGMAMDHMDMGQMDIAAHGHMMHAMSPVTLSEIVARAKGEHLAFPVLITPPGAPQRFGGKKDSGWTVKSEAQNRPLRVSITFDAMTGREKSRETFADKHPIDRVVGYGVAWHEGQLFGWINQLIGVLTALMLVTLAVSGFVMWRARKPADILGAPPPRRVPARIGGVAVIIALLAAFLPMLAFSLVAILLIERLILTPMPAARRWLGLPAG